MNNNNNNQVLNEEVENETSETKLEYAAPQLIVHGQVEKITMAEPSGPFGDGGEI